MLCNKLCKQLLCTWYSLLLHFVYMCELYFEFACFVIYILHIITVCVGHSSHTN